MELKNDFKICTVIQGDTLEAFVKNLNKAQKTAGMIELRADSIKDFNVDDIPIIKGPLKLPSIFTCRHINEGGLFKDSMANQKEILLEAFDSGFDYVDVAYDNSLAQELNKKQRKKLLLSFHCNEGTPDYTDLIALLDSMRTFNPAILKIATMVEDYDDIHILSALLKKKKKDEKLVVIGMGKRGQLTRLTFPPLGSYIAFVTMKGEKNIAPGMITAQDLKPIIKYIKK